MYLAIGLQSHRHRRETVRLAGLRQPEGIGFGFGLAADGIGEWCDERHEQAQDRRCQRQAGGVAAIAHTPACAPCLKCACHATLHQPEPDPEYQRVINDKPDRMVERSEEHTYELQSLMRISYA